MGLDQYANAHKGEQKKDEDGYTYYDDSIELGYWRKHPNLQGFMEELWIQKGKPNANPPAEDGAIIGSDFNCVDLVLTLEDLDSLESTLDSESLPETEGFFFGENSDDHYAKQDRDFIVAARSAIGEGYTVVYSSWW